MSSDPGFEVTTTRRVFLLRSLSWVVVHRLFGRDGLGAGVVPLSVAVGMVSVEEFQRFSDEDRGLVEATTAHLVAHYDRGWMRQERARLRADLTFFTGVP